MNSFCKRKIFVFLFFTIILQKYFKAQDTIISATEDITIIQQLENITEINTNVP